MSDLTPLPDDLFDALSVLAVKRGMMVEHLIDDILREYLRNASKEDTLRLQAIATKSGGQR